jgi:tetratricopeptide (TPR) repeat protein
MTVGRYLVGPPLGEGGMGVVYQAEDRLLGRAVALKVLRGAAGPASVAARQDLLFHEARALARLRSPHVVAVYDVGTFLDHVYLAMELMAQGSLRQRLAAWRLAPAPPGERLRLLLEAGRGLAAAHRAGVVHRDFKPDNVLLDAEGRAHVSDFGLALRVGEGARREGTRGYMAPEVAVGQVSPAADQYAFAVTAWEALAGEPPPGAGAALAPHVRRALQRALRPEPADRFPSMEALLEALEDDPAVARRGRLLWGLLAVLGALAAAVTGKVASQETLAERMVRECKQQAAVARSALWSPGRQAEVRQAFLAVGAAGAPALDRVLAHLGGEVAAWTELKGQACAQAPDSPERQRLEACLEERQKTLASLSELFATADLQVVTSAVNTLSLEVVPAALCGQAARPAARPAASAATSALRSRLARARVLLASGRKAQAAEAALRVGDEAERQGQLQVVAEARLLEGVGRGDLRQAEAGEVLRRAVTAADRAQADEERARAWVALSSWLASREEREVEARVALESADGVVERLGRPPLLEAERLTALGQLEAGRGDGPAARAAFASALQLRQGALPEAHPLVLNALANLANVLEPGERWPFQQQVLAGRLATFGPFHPDTALAQQNLGGTALALGDAAVALASFQRALDVYLKDPEGQSGRLGRVEAGLASALQRLQRPEEAVEHQVRAVDRLRLGGASDPELRRALEQLLELLVEAGRPLSERAPVREEVERLGGG